MLSFWCKVLTWQVMLLLDVSLGFQWLAPWHTLMSRHSPHWMKFCQRFVFKLFLIFFIRLFFFFLQFKNFNQNFINKSQKMFLSTNHFITTFAVCFGSLSGWNVQWCAQGQVSLLIVWWWWESWCNGPLSWHHLYGYRLKGIFVSLPNERPLQPKKCIFVSTSHKTEKTRSCHLPFPDKHFQRAFV